MGNTDLEVNNTGYIMTLMMLGTWGAAAFGVLALGSSGRRKRSSESQHQEIMKAVEVSCRLYSCKPIIDKERGKFSRIGLQISLNFWIFTSYPSDDFCFEWMLVNHRKPD